jgi:hypothetical protein
VPQEVLGFMLEEAAKEEIEQALEDEVVLEQSVG